MYSGRVGASVRSGEPLPPLLFQLAGHRLRWRLLSELAYSDRRVRELTNSLGEPQALVSYHLRRLRTAGIVSTHRSSHDGRDSYYSLDLDRFSELLGQSGAALHPGLRLAPATADTGHRPRRKPSVLFLCTGNSARSQMAEGFLRALAGDRFDAHSAGNEATQVRPLAVLAMAEMGIDISGQRSKNVAEYAGQEFDYAITVCDESKEACPYFPGAGQQLHWRFDDPAAAEGTDEQRLAVYRRVRDEIASRVREFAGA